MRTGSESPAAAPQRLVDSSEDVRAAVLLDPAGNLVAASGDDRAGSRRLAELAHEMVVTADAAVAEPTEQIEAQTGAGAVFVARDARYALACVVRRLGLPALILYDLRQTLLALDEAP